MAIEYGLIYGLTNPYFKGMVKIGLTHSLDISKRIHVLNTAAPLPFECAFAYKVPHDRLYSIEHVLHETYADKRVGTSEFFEVMPAKVDKLMSALGKFEPMKTMVQDTIDVEVAKHKSPNMDFFKMGLQKGDTLVFAKNATVVCSVVSNKKVLYNGEEYSLSGLTHKLLGTKYAVQPSPYWKTAAGVYLSSLYVEYVKRETVVLAALHAQVSDSFQNVSDL